MLPQPPHHRPSQGFAFIIELIVVALVLLVIVAAITTRSRSDHHSTPSPTATQTLKGFSLSPNPQSSSGLADFLTQAQRTKAKVVSWAGDWNELGDPKAAPATIAQLGGRYGYQPIIEVTAFRDDGTNLMPIRSLTDSQKTTYAQLAAQFAKTQHLKYLGVGIEVNRLDATALADFAGLFNQTYAAVKTASPSTQVFTTFQFEKMKGLNGGLFGGANDPATSQWAILDSFQKADFFAFTTYPSLIYHQPEDIPKDYYTELTEHTKKPVAFTETGWPATTPAAGWNSTPQAQASYVARFGTLTQVLNPVFSVWSFLYDPPAKQPFTSMGLIGQDNTVRPGLSTFESIK